MFFLLYTAIWLFFYDHVPLKSANIFGLCSLSIDTPNWSAPSFILIRACPSVHPDLTASMASFWGFSRQSKNGQSCVSPCAPGFNGLGYCKKIRFANVFWILVTNMHFTKQLLLVKIALKIFKLNKKKCFNIIRTIDSANM